MKVQGLRQKKSWVDAFYFCAWCPKEVGLPHYLIMFVVFLHELNTMSHPNYFHDWKDNSLIKVVTIRIDPKDYLFSMINWSCILFELPICTILFLIQKRRKNTTLNCNLAFHTYPKPIYKLKTMDASCRKKGHIFHFGTSCWPYILFFQTFFQNSGLSTSMKQMTYYESIHSRHSLFFL